MQQKPTLGAIVLVPMKPAENNGADQAPAVITRVWSDVCVNLRVLVDGPEVRWRTSCTYIDDLDGAQHGHLWTWPETEGS